MAIAIGLFRVLIKKIDDCRHNLFTAGMKISVALAILPILLLNDQLDSPVSSILPLVEEGFLSNPV